jgi:hypothetical protein
MDSVFVFPAQPDDARMSLSLRISSFIVVCTILAVTMVPVGILRYWKPSIPVPLTLVFAGGFLSLVYGFYWPYQLDQFASDQPSLPGELPAPLRDQIHLTIQNPSWDVSRTWDENSDYAKKNLEFRLTQKLHFNGVTRPLLLWRLVSTGDVSLLSGRKLTCQNWNSEPDIRSYWWGYDYLRMECSNIVPTNPNYENSDRKETYTFYGHTGARQEPDISDVELPGASINGSHTFEVARLNILSMMPLKVGALLTLKRQVFEIRQVVPSEKAIRVLLNQSMVPLLLRGDLESLLDERFDSVPFFIINRRTGEILNSSSESVYFNPFDGLSLQWLALTRKHSVGAPKDEPPLPIPGNWLDDADICFDEIESLGTVNIPYSEKVTNIIR